LTGDNKILAVANNGWLFTAGLICKTNA